MSTDEKSRAAGMSHKKGKARKGSEIWVRTLTPESNFDEVLCLFWFVMKTFPRE